MFASTSGQYSASEGLFEVDPDETSVSSLEEDASVVAKTSAAKSRNRF